MSTAAAIRTHVHRVAELLATRERKIVFAESCTGGLIAGALTAVPGISNWHCGGVIVYRNETKHALLGISHQVLVHPGAVSEEVARQMAEGVLRLVPEADLSLAITGHLGPNAPPELDGVVWLAIAVREKEASFRAVSKQLQLPAEADRQSRQQLAVAAALEWLANELEMMAA